MYFSIVFSHSKSLLYNLSWIYNSNSYIGVNYSRLIKRTKIVEAFFFSFFFNTFLFNTKRFLNNSRIVVADEHYNRIEKLKYNS